MADNHFKSTVESLLEGMEHFITSKTVVGEAIHIGDTIILPLVDVTFGVGAGAFSGKDKNNGAGGMGGKISPNCVLVISDGNIKLVNIKNQDTITKVLDMIPDITDKVASKFGKSKDEAKDLEEEIRQAADASFDIIDE